jgi:hypothetical protein
VPVPTQRPSYSPTTSSTSSVSVEFTCTASATPTASDEAKLKTAVENATNIDGAVVKNFDVTYVTARRRLSSSQSNDLRRLSTYIWTVSCDIVADLTVIGESSIASFASTVNSNLNSGTTLSDLITSSVTSVTTVDAVTIAANTGPTMAPTKVPSVGATDGGGSSKASANILIIIIICVGVVVVAVAGYFIKQYAFKEDENEFEMKIDDDAEYTKRPKEPEREVELANNELPPKTTTL